MDGAARPVRRAPKGMEAPPPSPVPDDDRLAAIVGAAAQVGGRIAEILMSNVAPSVAEQRVAGALAFLRRRLTGDYEIDEFGFDPELTDSVLLALLRPLYKRWFRVQVRGSRTSRPRAGRWWWPTTPARSRSTR